MEDTKKTASNLLQQQASPPKLPVLERVARSKQDGSPTTPVCVIVVGMAGSGKTTLMAQLQRSLDIATDEGDSTAAAADTTMVDAANMEESQEDCKPAAIPTAQEQATKDDDKMTNKRKTGYCINLDPATLLVPFGASLDIRDTVDYKQVIKQHGLGPNGAIMTCLNLYCTKFDQVLQILEKRATTSQYILVDTPGQIEAFTWSASGSIITQSLASSFPTVLAFVVDTPRCASSPNTFMSNMLYACSMLYRTKLPLVVVFNKIDVVPHDFCQEWMQDYESFQNALDENTDSGYYGSLTRSLSLVLDEFYSNLHTCGVSAATGDGVDEFWNTVDRAAQDFEADYLEDLKLQMQQQEAKRVAKARDSVERLERDLEQERESGV